MAETYEGEYYDRVLARMLASVPEDMDKRESSIIYNLIAPVALALADVYLALDAAEDNTYPDTADREHLLRLADMLGVGYNDGAAAQMSVRVEPAETDIEGVGLLWTPAPGNLTKPRRYTPVESLGEGLWTVLCDETGRDGTRNPGDALLPETDVEGLESVKVTAILAYGADPEDTEEIRAGVTVGTGARAYAGNEAFWRGIAMETPGVIGVSVRPVTPQSASDANVELLAATDDDGSAGSAQIIEAIQSAADARAPFHQKVRVGLFTPREIRLTYSYIVEDDYPYETAAEIAALQRALIDAQDDYLREKLFTLTRTGTVTLRAYELQAALTRVEGIKYIRSLTLDGGAQVAVAVPQRPVLTEADVDGGKE